MAGRWAGAAALLVVGAWTMARAEMLPVSAARRALGDVRVANRLPPWLRTAAAFDAAVARATPQGPVVRVVQRDADLETFAPTDRARRPNRGLFLQGPGFSADLFVDHRLGGCVAADCMRPMIATHVARGDVLIWQRTVTLPLGPGGQALLVREGRLRLIWAVPYQLRVAVVRVEADVDVMADLLPALRMVTEGLRRLGPVLGSPRAEALREGLANMPPADVRWAARREQADHRGPSCPIAEVYSRLAGDATRAALLADVFLATADPVARRALLECAVPVEEAARDVALPALLDDELPIQDYGSDAVARHSPLILRLVVPDAPRRAARAFPANPRIRVEVIDEAELKVTIRPPAEAVASSLSPEDRARLLAPSRRLEVNAPAIAAQAERLTKSLGEARPEAVAARVIDWVHRHVRYTIDPLDPGAAATLQSGEGDCSEYAALTVALLRAAGVPARVVSGLTVEGDALVAHAWVEFYDGQAFREVDPTANRMEVDAGYLPATLPELLPVDGDGLVRVVAVEGG